jgi:catechol 2,3-dioxygenase
MARTTKPKSKPVHPKVRIGHVHLKVADLEPAKHFTAAWSASNWPNVPDATLRSFSRVGIITTSDWIHGGAAVALHHRPPAPAFTIRQSFIRRGLSLPTLCSEMHADISLDAPTTGWSEARYLRDPGENGVELYWDRPREQRPRTADGAPEMFTHPLDLDSLLAEAETWTGKDDYGFNLSKALHRLASDGQPQCRGAERDRRSLPLFWLHGRAGGSVSVRPTRFGARPAAWIAYLQRHDEGSAASWIRSRCRTVLPKTWPCSSGRKRAHCQKEHAKANSTLVTTNYSVGPDLIQRFNNVLS